MKASNRPQSASGPRVIFGALKPLFCAEAPSREAWQQKAPLGLASRTREVLQGPSAVQAGLLPWKGELQWDVALAAWSSCGIPLASGLKEQ